MLGLSGPKAILFLQLLIAFITRSVVNVCTISNGFLLVSFVTTLVSLEEVCLPSFELFNCWLNLVASCLHDENEIPLKVIASCSAINSLNSSPQLGQVRLLVHGFNKVSIFAVCAHRYDSGWIYSILAVQVRWVSFTEVILSVHHVQYLCWYRFLMESVASSRDVV